MSRATAPGHGAGTWHCVPVLPDDGVLMRGNPSLIAPAPVCATGSPQDRPRSNLPAISGPLGVDGQGRRGGDQTKQT